MLIPITASVTETYSPDRESVKQLTMDEDVVTDLEVHWYPGGLS